MILLEEVVQLGESRLGRHVVPAHNIRVEQDLTHGVQVDIGRALRRLDNVIDEEPINL